MNSRLKSGKTLGPGWAGFVLVLVLSVTLTGCQPGLFGPDSETEAAHLQHLEELPADEVHVVGFDLDDTLLFSTPSFREAFSRDVEPFSEEFWTVVNSSDAELSCTKEAVKEILVHHQEQGRTIYVSTAREPHNPGPVRSAVSRRFDIPPDNVYFDPETKVDTLEELGVDVYYGDSDSDIADARESGAVPFRIERNPESSYEQKYNPGELDERIVPNTTAHTCP